MAIPRRMGVADICALGVCTATLGMFIGYPSVRALCALYSVWRWDVLASGAGLWALVNTVWISLVSAACAGVVGTGLALLLYYWRFPGSRLLSVLAYLPFALPPLVGVVAFYFLIGRDGLITHALEQLIGVQDAALKGPWAILVIHVYSFQVFFYAMAGASLQSMDPSMAEAARTLGAGVWRTFTRVTLPCLRPAVMGAALLAFMSSGASFSAPLLFGEGFPMLSVRIFEESTQFNEAAALTLTAALAVVALAGVLVFRARSGVGRAGKGTYSARKLARGKILAGVFSACVISVL